MRYESVDWIELFYRMLVRSGSLEGYFLWLTTYTNRNKFFPVLLEDVLLIVSSTQYHTHRSLYYETKNLIKKGK
jgi:hypothetical protein